MMAFLTTWVLFWIGGVALFLIAWCGWRVNEYHTKIKIKDEKPSEKDKQEFEQAHNLLFVSVIVLVFIAFLTQRGRIWL